MNAKPEKNPVQRILQASDGRCYGMIHGTMYRAVPKLRKKQRIAARRACN